MYCEFKTHNAFALLRTSTLAPDHINQVVTSLLPSPKAYEKNDKLRLTSIIKNYTEEKQSNWTDKTKLEVGGVFKLLVDILGDVDVCTITRPKLIELRSSLLKVPPNFYVKNRGCSVKEAIKKSAGDGLSIKTVNKHMARIGSLLKYCQEQAMIIVNPATGMQIADKQRIDQERSAYSVNDIKKIVSNLPLDRPERYWIPLIGLYSGMRLAEICQLHVEDIIKVDDCWCFDINNAGDKQLKNEASVRVIPVHQKLIELGLMDYVDGIRKSGNPRLWMNLSYIHLHGYTNTFGKWYQRYNREYVTEDPKKVFHSMRHAAADMLKQKGVSEALIAEILGHAHASITTGRYGKRYQPKVLLDALEQLDYAFDIPTKWC
jgi:integrase